jgi:sugar/nucleoside kinase (ribokinase family)
LANLASSRSGCKVLFEPTSEPKGVRFAKSGLLKHCDLCTPNRGELLAMAGSLGFPVPEQSQVGGVPSFTVVRAAADFLLPKLKVGGALVVSLGGDGVLVLDAARGSRTFKAVEGVQVKNATGAGDTQTGGILHALNSGKGIDESVRFGMECAKESLQCEERAISPTLNKLALKLTHF